MKRTALNFVALGCAVVFPLWAFSAQAASKGPPQIFKQCAVCHSVVPGGPVKIGPTLAGVAGSAAAAQPGFAYSAALKGARIKWTDEKLNQFLTQPAKTVPGTKMAFVGITDAKVRAEVIAYLKTLR